MELHPLTSEAYQLLHNGTLALTRAEQQGIHIDMEYCEKTVKQLTRRIIKMEIEFKDTKFCRRWAHTVKTLNIYSDDQLRGYLYKVLKLKANKSTTSGKGSTDEDTLKQLNIPELDDLIQLNKLKKIRDTYLASFMREQVNGVIRPFFNLHIARTFRSSSNAPNFQNIPKRDEESMLITRKALFPRPGHQLLEVDYKGVEVCVSACYNKDPVLIKYIEDPTSDMHLDMAEKIFLIKNMSKKIPEHKKLRDAIKNGFVFPEFYGSYYKNCAINLACSWGELPKGSWKKGQGIPVSEGVSLSDHLISKGIKSLNDFTDHVKEIEDHFWERFCVYERWKNRFWRTYQKAGYFDMYTGFRCSGIMNKNDVTNYPNQGSAFHCLLWSFIEIDKVMRSENWDTRLIGQIHDAIVLDVNPDELKYIGKIIKRITCEDLPKAYDWINVPLNVDADLAGIDESWAEVKAYQL